MNLTWIVGRRDGWVGGGIMSKEQRQDVVIEDVKLSDVKRAVEEILEGKTGKKWSVEIHITTNLTGEVKANVQGVVGVDVGSADVLISGELEFRKLFRVVAHEVVHLVYPELSENDKKFGEEMEKIEKEMKQKLARRWGR